ncbi:MAG TPA: (2Fe-2S)-binding protein, partial [Terriglobales bacterium]|nr:(2Fe-2S)-binding protein [Terriglobales bacterium]
MPSVSTSANGLLQLQLTVNGKAVRAEVEPRTLLVELIRDMLDLPGTHIGCDTSFCGACTVLLNGRSAKSCTLLAVQADGGELLTVEGLERDGKLHPVQQAFAENHGLQCGFCTPGMMISAVHLLEHEPKPSEQQIRKAIAGNCCRCTGYQNIFRSVAA